MNENKLKKILYFRLSIRPTTIPTIKLSSTSGIKIRPTKTNDIKLETSSTQILRNKTPTNLIIDLEPSGDMQITSTIKIEPTETLKLNRRTRYKSSTTSTISNIKYDTKSITTSKIKNNHEKERAQTSLIRKTDLKFKESASKMMEIIGTVVHEFIQNSTNERVKIIPQEV